MTSFRVATILALSAGWLMATALPASAQQMVGGWSLVCQQPANSGNTCAASQGLSNDATAMVVRASGIGLNLELVLGPNRGSPTDVIFYSGARQAGRFDAGQIFFSGREGDTRRFRLTGSTEVRGTLDAMLRSDSLVVSVDYATGESDSFTLQTAETISLFTAIREVVDF